MAARTESGQSGLPLSGIRVIEIATLAAAPMVGTLLAEFGAEVIKLEDPGQGDPVRRWGARKDGIGLMWKSLGRNKKVATLDLRNSEGQSLLRRLICKVDVLIVNTRPSTLEKWGLDYQALHAVNEKLIMLHITGFGAGGRFSDRPGFGTLGEAMSGFAHLTGQPDGPPTLPPFPLADGVASLTATYSTMMALYNRDANGGGGQLIDVNLIEPLARLLEHTVLVHDQLAVTLTRFGNRWDVSAPRNTYRTADDRWIAMSGSTPTIVNRVFKAIGRPELIEDERFRNEVSRLANADEIDHLVSVWIGDRTLEEAMSVFVRHEVAAAPVYDAAQLVADPHLADRETFIRVEDAELGSMLVQGPVPRLSETPGRVDHLGRPLGADNEEVYCDVFGLDRSEFLDLATRGII